MVRSVRRLRTDTLLLDAVLMFGKSVIVAISGAVFWLVAARLLPAHDVGIAGTLVSASMALSYFALVGMNYSLIWLLPRSSHPAADLFTSVLITGAVGMVLGIGYALVAPAFSSELALLRSPLVVVSFGALIAGSVTYLMTDSAFLVLRAMPQSLAVNGGLMGVLRCLLPFALAPFAGYGIFVAVGLSSTIAAVVGLLLLLRRLPRPDRWIMRAEPIDALAQHAGAGYVTSVLDLTPLLMIPLLVLNENGAADSGVFFVSWQVAMLLSALMIAVAGSMYAEGARNPETVSATSRRGGLIMGAATSLAVAVLVPLSPMILAVFGPEYADRGTTTLRVLALSGLAVALHTWTLTRLRITVQLRASVIMQAVTLVAVLGLVWYAAPRGLVWVAVAWGVGQLAGALAGLVAVRWGTPGTPARAAGAAFPDSTAPEGEAVSRC